MVDFKAMLARDKAIRTNGHHMIYGSDYIRKCEYCKLPALECMRVTCKGRKSSEKQEPTQK